MGATLNTTSTTKAHPWWSKLAPATFLLLWSSGFIFSKLGLRNADPLTFLCLRFASAVALLIVAFLWIRPPLPRAPQTWFSLAVVGLFLQAGYFSFMYLSLKLGISTGAIALITSQQPILVGLIVPLLTGERVSSLRWIGLALGTAGSAAVILAQSSVTVSSFWSIAFAILALVCITTGTLCEKRLGTSVHPVTGNLVQYSVALVAVVPFAILLEPMNVRWNIELLASLGYLVIFNSIIATSLLLGMIRVGEASKVSALFFLVPPTTALVAFIFLHETIAGLAWPGMLLAAIGLYLVIRN